MNWQRLLTNPPPTTAWLLDGTVVAGLRWDSDGSIRCGVEAMPEGACEVGRVGLQAIDKDRLAAVIDAVNERIDGARRAAVVLPTGWVRTNLFEFDEMPRKRAELSQVVRWRLKKLLPVLPSELRLSAMPQRADGRRRLLVCMVGVERAMADLEETFSRVGIVPGLMTPRLFALASGPAAGRQLLVQQEEGFLSLLLVVDDVVRLLRTKPLATGSTADSAVPGEMRLALQFIRSDLGVDGEIVVYLSTESETLTVELAEWWKRQAAVRLEEPMVMLPFADPALADRLGGARVEPALRLIERVDR